MPFFSVIIPTFNRALLLRWALESVWSQRFTDYDIIVVDDGSTDETQDYLKSLGSRITCLTQPTCGPGAARNLGARHAKGEYLAFLDSDDAWFPWTLDVYKYIVRSNNGPYFIAGRPYRFWNEEELQKVAEETIRTNRFPDYLSSGDEWRWWGVSSFVIRRDAFFAIGGFTNQPVNGEDADLALRLGLAEGFVQVKSPVTFGYREHATNAMKNFDRTIAGVWHNIRAEKERCYPGGPARAHERWRILTRHMRPVTLECLRHGIWRDAWRLYRATFLWNVALWRWKYLTWFLVIAMWSALQFRQTGQRC